MCISVWVSSKSGKYERLFHIFIHFKSIFYFFLNQLKQLEPYAYFNHKYIYIFHVVSYNLNELGRSPLKDFLPYLIIYSVLFTILMVFHYFYFIFYKYDFKNHFLITNQSLKLWKTLDPNATSSPTIYQRKVTCFQK